MRRAALIVAVFLAGACQDGQDRASETGLAAATTDLPETDIYVADLVIDGDRRDLSGLRALVDGEGYQNQPFFADGADRLLFVSENAAGKTDLWRSDIETNEMEQLTQSADRSEFSPKPSPSGGLSYIQESPDGEVTRVHEDGAAVMSLAPLGYYAWLDGGDALGVFYRSEPPELQLVEIKSGAARTIAAAIGRSLHSAPSGERLYFTSEVDGALTLFEAAAGEDWRPSAIATMPPGFSEDFSVVFDAQSQPVGVYASAGKRVLFSSLPAKDASWTIVKDFSDLGAPSRIAVAPGEVRIAIVISRL